MSGTPTRNVGTPLNRGDMCYIIYSGEIKRVEYLVTGVDGSISFRFPDNVIRNIGKTNIYTTEEEARSQMPRTFIEEDNKPKPSNPRHLHPPVPTIPRSSPDQSGPVEKTITVRVGDVLKGSDLQNIIDTYHSYAVLEDGSRIRVNKKNKYYMMHEGDEQYFLSLKYEYEGRKELELMILEMDGKTNQMSSIKKAEVTTVPVKVPGSGSGTLVFRVLHK